MSNWHGKMGRGAGKARRIEKREEARARDAASTYNADIRRVAREQNVSPRTARHAVNAERKLSRGKAQYHAGYEAYVMGGPVPADASKLFHRGWERALTDERGETDPATPALPYLADTSSTACLDAGLTCSIDPATGRCTECGEAEITGTGAYGGGQCLYVLDGHDTDGTAFHRCTVHDCVEISPDAPCAGA